MQRSRIRRASIAALCLAGVAALASGCSAPSFDGELAFGFLERQCQFGPRYPGSDGHEAMREWLVATLDGYADAVSVQEFTVERTDSVEVVLANVIASFNMDAPERVLLGAHWDTRPIAEHDPDEANRGTPILGANDGGSGVAVLLALAAMMSERTPAVGVDLVFFTGSLLAVFVIHVGRCNLVCDLYPRCVLRRTFFRLVLPLRRTTVLELLQQILDRPVVHCLQA